MIARFAIILATVMLLVPGSAIAAPKCVPYVMATGSLVSPQRIAWCKARRGKMYPGLWTGKKFIPCEGAFAEQTPKGIWLTYPNTGCLCPDGSLAPNNGKCPAETVGSK